jgi:hypothetical protein
MADIYLNVPYVPQKNIGGHVAGADTRDDPTGCWYAAICMLGYYREQGPRLGVPEQYVKPDGSPQKVDKKGNTAALAMGKNYEKLMENEGLTTVPLPKDKKWTCTKLAMILRDCGPCYVRRGWIKNGKLTGGHAVVLVGARESDKKVVIHDPGSRGHDWECSIDEFNAFFKWDGSKAEKYSMMCKLPPVNTRARSNAISL